MSPSFQSSLPEAEIAAHPDALHNSNFKMQRRKEMLEGKRPTECDYCWKIEDISPTLMSDRMLKSGEDWAMPEFEKIKTIPGIGRFADLRRSEL